VLFPDEEVAFWSGLTVGLCVGLCLLIDAVQMLLMRLQMTPGPYLFVLIVSFYMVWMNRIQEISDILFVSCTGIEWAVIFVTASETNGSGSGPECLEVVATCCTGICHEYTVAIFVIFFLI